MGRFKLLFAINVALILTVWAVVGYAIYWLLMNVGPLLMRILEKAAQ